MSNLTIFSPDNPPNLRYDLQDYGNRLIDAAWDKAIQSRINVIVAPTGAGKTYHTVKNVAKRASNKISRYVIFAPERGICKEIIANLKKEKRLTKDINVAKMEIYSGAEIAEFLDSKSDNTFTLVLVTTIQHVSVQRKVRESFLQCLDSNCVIVADEADIGGNTDAVMKHIETGRRQSNYSATYTSLARDCIDRGATVYYLTATPLREQGEEFGNDIYNDLNKDVPWVSIEERTEGYKSLNSLTEYDFNHTSYEKSIRDAVDLYYAKADEIMHLDKLILSKDPNAPLHFKGVAMFNGGPKNQNGKKSKNSLTNEDQLSIVINQIKKNHSPRHGKDDYIFVVGHDDVYDLYNLKGHKKTIKEWNEVSKKLHDADDPLCFTFHVNKMGRGLNILNCILTVSSRERLQAGVDDESITTQSIRQFWGRAVRPYYGLKNLPELNFHYVSGVIDWVDKKYDDYKIKNLYMQRFLLTNSFDIISSKNDTFDKANRIFVKDYISGIEDSQFNAMFLPNEVKTGPLDKFMVTQPHDKTCNCDKCDYHNGTTKQGLDKTLGI